MTLPKNQWSDKPDSDLNLKSYPEVKVKSRSQTIYITSKDDYQIEHWLGTLKVTFKDGNKIEMPTKIAKRLLRRLNKHLQVY